MKRIKFVNWNEYQHYKDRNPPWIKLHTQILSSRAWVTLSDASRVLAIACMILASKNDGEVDCDGAYLKRVAYLNKEPNFDDLVRSGLCTYVESGEDASKLLADASNSPLLSSVSDSSLLITAATSKDDLYKLADGKAWAQTWREWVDCRMEKKKCKNWMRMFSSQFKMLCESGDDAAPKMMQQSIRNDWQGLFEVKEKPTAKKIPHESVRATETLRHL